MMVIIMEKVRWLKGEMSFDLQLASSKKGARKTNLKQDKLNWLYFKTDSESVSRTDPVGKLTWTWATLKCNKYSENDANTVDHH